MTKMESQKTISRFCVLLAAVGLFVWMTSPAFSCSAFAAVRGGKVMTAANFDMKNLDIKIWFVPPEKGKYGCFFMGLGYGYPLGGMNDQGLTINSTGTAGIKIHHFPGKQTIRSRREAVKLNIKLFQTCATVDDVLTFFNKYNSLLMETHLIISDKTGLSVIWEATPEGHIILYYPDKAIRYQPDEQLGDWRAQEPEPLPPHMQTRQGDFLVITNFHHSDPKRRSVLGEFPCRRYETAKKMLDNSETISVDLFSGILDQIHLEKEMPTKYSVVQDLDKGELYIYYLHNFKKAIKFSLQEEFKKGGSAYDLRALFKLRYHPLYLLSALLFISALLAFPVRLVLQVINRKDPTRQAGLPGGKIISVLAWFLAAVNSVLLLIIIYRYPYILSHGMEMVKHNLYVNFFYYHGTIFYAAMLLTPAMLVFAALAWIKKYLSLPERIHYSLITSISLMVLWIMI